MDNSILELFKMLSSNNPFNMQNNSQNPPSPNDNNPAYSFYPKEAYSNQNSQNNSVQNQNQSINDNILPLLMSILTKNNSSLAEIFSAKPKENENKPPKSPNEELLL